MIAACLAKVKDMIIDLSSNNGKIDFSQLTRVDEIFVRSSLGYGEFDKKLNENANGAHDTGIPVSYYHFAYPHGNASPVADAMKQANYFCDTISKLPIPSHLAVDLENFSTTSDTKLSQNDYSIWLQTFLDTVEGRLGIKCIIYTYADYLNRHLPVDHTFGKYPLWLANYSAISVPKMPIGWDNYFMWQYSEKGVLAGIEGHVDLSKVS